MSSQFGLVKEILKLYEDHNPLFAFIALEAEHPITPYLHQVEFLLRTSLRRPLRVFIADEIGLGKTITALASLKRLENLGLVKRALIAVPRILIPQWISELQRIGLGHRIKRIERYTIEQLVYHGFPEGFYLASMDLIKRDRYFKFVEKVNWDVVIVDEAHRLGKDTDRIEKIGKELISSVPSRNAILLSATPHRGDPEDYLARLAILDPYLGPTENLDTIDFYSLTYNVLIFRRTKIDVNDVYERRKVFTDCYLEAVIVPASANEVEFHRELVGFLRAKLLGYYDAIEEAPKAVELLTTLIFKRASSSPYAAIRTLENIIKARADMLRLYKGVPSVTEEIERGARSLADSIFGTSFHDYEESEEEEGIEPDKALDEFATRCSVFLFESDVKKLERLIELAREITKHDSRLLAVKKLIHHYLTEGRKVIVFTEYKDTAGYIFEALIKELGKRAVIRLTSEEAGDEEKLKEVRRRFEKDPKCVVMIATDVASEGLNLQISNVVINYEAPWSPIKLEQRIGRVWRLGQVSDVTIHTIFLAVDTDRDVLEVLYRKVIALGRAIPTKKSPIGEEAVVINMKSVEEEKAPLELSEFMKGPKKMRFTEHTLIREYVRGGREALIEIAGYMVQTIQRLKEDLRRFNVFPQVSRETVERLLHRGVGFTGVEETFELLKDLLKALLHMTQRLGFGTEFKEEKGKLMVITSGGAPIAVDSPHIAFKLIKKVLEQYPSGTHVSPSTPYIVARGKEDAELRIYEVAIVYGKRTEEIVLYKEPVGLYIVNGAYQIKRGFDLLKLLTLSLENLAFAADEYTVEPQGISLAFMHSKLKSTGQDLVRMLDREFTRYKEKLAERGWRRLGDEWCPEEGKCVAKVGKLIGIVKFTSEEALLNERNIDIFTKKRVELRAMEHAMNYEIEHDRKPLNVSETEHFDILSKDPKMGEVRYIEVKGHGGPSLIAELSEDEYGVAADKGDEYWVYIVHSINTGIPQLIAVRNPAKNMKMRIIETRRYLLTL